MVREERREKKVKGSQRDVKKNIVPDLISSSSYKKKKKKRTLILQKKIFNKEKMFKKIFNPVTELR